jgi:branched-chain amino acid transport system permease protein
MTDGVFFIVLVLDGVLAGAVYAVVALAFVVVYKASRMINFALGEWVLLASRLAASGFHALGLGLLGALGFAGASMVAAGVLVSRLISRRLSGRPLISLIMVSLGLGILIRGATPLVFARIPGGMPLPIPELSVAVQDVPIASEKLIAATVATLAIGALTWFFHRSRTGVALRALANDQQAAMTVGISLERYLGIAWALAGALAVVAGVLWSAVPGGGFGVDVLGRKVFPIVVIGGLESFAGTILAAILIGVLESLAVGYLDPVVGSGFSEVVAYVVLLAIVFVRPYGLVGRPDAVRV